MRVASGQRPNRQAGRDRAHEPGFTLPGWFRRLGTVSAGLTSTTRMEDCVGSMRILLSVAIVVLLLSGRALAEPFPPLASDDARAHLADGQKEYELGHWDAAIEHFEAGARIEDSNSWFWNLAQAHRQAGNLERARWNYDRVVARLDGDPDAARFIELAKKYISEIDAEMAARPPPKDEERPVVVVRAEPSAFTTQRKIAIGVGAAGLTSLGLAVAFGVHSGSLRDDATALCPTTSCDNADEANVLLRRADTSARNANIATGVGAGAIVLAGVLWILGKPEHSSPAAVTTTARVSPSFAGIDITMRF